MMHVRWRASGTLLMRVRRPGDILKTLDADGKLDGLQFMPELVKYCGAWIRVHRRADRTCVVGELRKHLDEKGGNCGLGFPSTMMHAIGQRYRVALPIRRIILEQTGTMVTLDHTVAPDGLLCEGTEVANCPRAEYLYCRESWLTRTPETAAGAHPAGA